jgi:hypothetical protein
VWSRDEVAGLTLKIDGSLVQAFSERTPPKFVSPIVPIFRLYKKGASLIAFLVTSMLIAIWDAMFTIVCDFTGMARGLAGSLFPPKSGVF